MILNPSVKIAVKAILALDDKVFLEKAEVMEPKELEVNDLFAVAKKKSIGMTFRNSIRVLLPADDLNDSGYFP